MDRRKKDYGWAFLFIAPQLVGLIIFFLIPLVATFVISMMKWDGFGEKEFVGLYNFKDQFQDEYFMKALINTMYYTLLVVPICTISSLLVAIGLNKIKGKVIYRLFYFMPVVASSIAVSVVFLWILNPDTGVLNVYLREWFGIEPPNWLADARTVIPVIAAVGIWWTFGYNMVMFLAGLQGISSQYYEAAQIDGAGKFSQLWNITIPLLTPTLFFVTIMSLISSFQVFEQSYVMTGGGPARASYTMVLHIYEMGFDKFAFGKSAAAAAILFGMIFIITMVQMAVGRKWVHYEG
jgi:multiple sugar transport system permease protein